MGARNADRFNEQDIANSLLALDQMGLKWRALDHDLQSLLLDATRRNAITLMREK